MVAGEVFRCAVHDQIDPQFERSQQHRRRERRIHDRLDPMRAREGRQRPQIGHAQVRIGRRLTDDEARVGTYRGPHRVEIARLDERVLDTKRGQRLDEKLSRAPIAIAKSDDVRALLREREDRRGHRSHPRRKRDRLCAACGRLQRREPRLERARRRVSIASIFLAIRIGMRAREERGELRRRRKRERCARDDRRWNRAAELGSRRARVHGARRGPSHRREARRHASRSREGRVVAAGHRRLTPRSTP